MREAAAKLRILRRQPFNFLSRAQSGRGADLARRALDHLHAGRALPSFADLEEIVTNPHAIVAFHDWCQRERRFAIWTIEALDRLAEYLRGRRFRRILEIGSGRGDLAWHLATRGVQIVATDAGPEALRGFTLPEYRAVPVEIWENVSRLDYRAALGAYHPDCVLCAWMPPHDDWTVDLRAQAGLEEFVLFWELRGTTGGQSAFRSQVGWRARDLVDVEEVLIGRTDEGIPSTGLIQYTRATAFSRVES
ncbi:MAG: hypothetical protein FJ033_12030 [Chloroflexi bacterium]|nr:hypothetical protein [Chloroflexota bacterium]